MVMGLNPVWGSEGFFFLCFHPFPPPCPSLFPSFLPSVQDPKLTRWAHETLLQVLDGDLLPVYLDVLQVLKAKVGCTGRTIAKDS